MDLSSYSFVDTELPTCGIFSVDNIWNVLEGGRSSGMIFAKIYTLYISVKSFSYMLSIGRHFEQNILKFDWAVFSLKRKGLKLDNSQIRCILSSCFLTLVGALLTTVILHLFFSVRRPFRNGGLRFHCRCTYLHVRARAHTHTLKP